MTNALPPEAALARFAAKFDAAALPEPVSAFARLVLLDALASALAGAQAEEQPAVERLARDLGGPGANTVIAGGSASMLGATFLNAFQVTAATVCDVHRPTLCHVTPEVLPAVLAVGESVGASGAEVLAAFVVGLETTVRVAAALDTQAYRERGWHNPGVAGPFGAAAAAGRLLGLDPTGMAAAFGHAGGQAAGTFAALGTSGVKFHQARGAVSGLLAAHLAAAGFDASPQALSAPVGGLLGTYAAGGEPDRLTEGLGSTWRFTELSLRRWPGASSIQSLIEAAAVIAERRGDSSVEQVRVTLPARSNELSGSAGWDGQLSALQSARYVAAVVLADRACWLEQFDRDHLADPALGAFARDRVRVDVDDDLAPAGAALSVDLADGRSLGHVVRDPLGSPARPLDEAQVIAKLGDAVAGLGHGATAFPLDALVDAVLHVDRLPTIAGLAALLALQERDLAS